MTKPQDDELFDRLMDAGEALDKVVNPKLRHPQRPDLGYEPETLEQVAKGTPFDGMFKGNSFKSQGDSKSPQPEPVVPSNQVMPLARLQEDFDNIELPWPEDIFGGFDKWNELDEFLRTLGYRVDNVSAELMRRGWKVHRKQVQDQVITAAIERLEDEAEAVENAHKGEENV